MTRTLPIFRKAMREMAEAVRTSEFASESLRAEPGEVRKRQGSLEAYENALVSFTTTLTPLVQKVQRECRVLMAFQAARNTK